MKTAGFLGAASACVAILLGSHLANESYSQIGGGNRAFAGCCDLDGSYDQGRLIAADAGPVDIRGAGGLTVEGPVDLPVDAIQASEIRDEPGVASALASGGLSLSGSVDVLLARSITVPAGGYVQVIGTLQANVGHTSGIQTHVQFGVSDSLSFLPANQDVSFLREAGLPTGTMFVPVTVHGLFAVGPGMHSFSLLGLEFGGVVSTQNMQLTLLYVPTAYGSVVSTLQGPGPLTPADVAAERQAELDRVQAYSRSP